MQTFFYTLGVEERTGEVVYEEEVGVGKRVPSPVEVGFEVRPLPEAGDGLDAVLLNPVGGPVRVCVSSAAKALLRREGQKNNDAAVSLAGAAPGNPRGKKAGDSHSGLSGSSAAPKRNLEDRRHF